MKRTLAKALIAASLLTGLALAPAVPAAAHNPGYVGYGCGSWDWVSWFIQARDCWHYQQDGCWLLMQHEYWGIAAPGTYWEWRPIC